MVKTNHEFKIDLSEYEVSLLSHAMDLIQKEFDEDSIHLKFARSVTYKLDTYIKPHIKDEQVTACFFKSEVSHLIRTALAFMHIYFNNDKKEFFSVVESLEKQTELQEKLCDSMQTYNEDIAYCNEIIKEYMELLDYTDEFLEELDGKDKNVLKDE